MDLLRINHCQINLIAFFDGLTGSVHEENAGDMICLDFSRAFDTHQYDSLV